ncbi:MAG: threonine/serine exporter family protein [Clostridia bacterium]|nr:threonine/serine exporter family protein [Clostridia bacterium]
MKTILFIFIGTLAVAGSADVRPNQLAVCGIGGVISYISLSVFEHMGANEIIGIFMSAVFVTVYSEITARILKTPATVFLYSGIVPLLPGGSLFHTVLCLIQKNSDGFVSLGIYTLIRSVSISMGIVTAASIFVLPGSLKSRLKKRVFRK